MNSLILRQPLFLVRTSLVLILQLLIQSFGFMACKADDILNSQVQRLSPVKAATLQFQKSLDVEFRDIVLDVGKQPVGVAVDLVLELTNNTAKPLDVSLVPSCGCAKIGFKDLQLKEGHKASIGVSLNLPGIEQRLSVSIACRDRNSNNVFKIFITGEVVADVVADPKVIKRTTNDKSSIKIRLFSPFEKVEIAAVSLLTGGFEVVSQRESSGAFHFVVTPKDYLGDRLVFSVTKRDGTTSIATVDCVFVDKVDVTPKSVVLTAEQNLFSGMVLIKGVDVAEFKNQISIVVTCFGEPNKNSPCEIGTIKCRNSDMAVVPFQLKLSDGMEDHATLKVVVSGVNGYGPWTQELSVSRFRR